MWSGEEGLLMGLVCEKSVYLKEWVFFFFKVFDFSYFLVFKILKLKCYL